MREAPQILMFVDCDITGPSVLWMRRMLSGLGNKVTTLVTEMDPGASYTERYHVVLIPGPASIRVRRLLHRLGLTQSVQPRSAIDVLLKAINSPQVDVVLVHYLTNAVNYDHAWRQTDRYVYVHCHGWDVTWNLRHAEHPHKQVHDRDYLDRIRALPDHVRFIANSRETIARLRDIQIPLNRIFLKYCGVDVPSTSPAQRRQDGELTILYLGRLVDCKGPDVVIQAFELASQRGLKAKLKIAGMGPLFSKCQAAREKSPYRDRIEVLGAVDAATGAALRRSCHIFTAHNQTGLQTRQKEAFGVALVEAMADGVPIVTGRSGGVPEVVEDGRQGILVEPGDVDSHAEALLNLARNPELRTWMGENGWARARDHFSTERETTRLLEILRLNSQHPTTEQTASLVTPPRIHSSISEV